MPKYARHSYAHPLTLDCDARKCSTEFRRYAQLSRGAIERVARLGTVRSRKVMDMIQLRDACCVLVTAGCMSIGPASAQDLVYTPINPSFGGNALNSTHLLSIASAQRSATASDAPDPNDPNAGGDDGSSGTSDADLFVRQLEGRLLSALAGQVTEAIFGNDPQDGGLVTFGTTTVQFDRTLDSITLLITDSLDGTVTEIIVPQLVTSGS